MIETKPAIYINNLKKHYAGAYAPALDGLSLQVKRGQIFGLLGPNGAGKTTTISILCGLVHADHGEAEIFGMNTRSETELIRRLIGLVPQHIALYPSLTGMENLIYIGQLYGLEKSEVKIRSSNLLDRLGLAQHADKRVSRYSGGMKRRVNIIASLLHEPELVILDEPTAGVDVQSRALILSFLKDYKEVGKTIVYTSHHLEEAEQLCEEVAIIDEGKLITAGTPEALISNTPHAHRLEDVFLHYTGHSVRD